MTKDQLNKEKYLPDLRIRTVEYSVNQRRIESTDPGKPRGTHAGLIDIELNITIENIGSGDWNDDLCALFIFDEYVAHNIRVMLLENIKIGYASKTTRLVNLDNIIRRSATITIIINPREDEFLECQNYSIESIYSNNSYIINL